MAVMTWVACEMLTGRVIAYLPDLIVDEVGITMGTHRSCEATLPLIDPPADWDRATTPKATWIVLLVDGEPLWGGMVVRRPKSGSDVLSMTLATPEAYLADRFVGDASYAAKEQCTMLADLVSDWALTGGPTMGLDVTPGTTLHDRIDFYKDSADQTVLSQITELSQIDGGPEWTIRWEHLTDPERYRPVLVVADELGTPCAPGMRPVTFEMPGALTDLVIDEDWSTGRGATRVIATTTPQGDTRPQSPPQSSADPMRPVIESRFTPSTSITEVSTLTAHAAARLAVMRDGATSVSLEANLDAAPRLGRDWHIGDCLGYTVPAGVAPAWPAGVSGQGRVIGWTLSLREPMTITPILASEETS